MTVHTSTRWIGWFRQGSILSVISYKLANAQGNGLITGLNVNGFCSFLFSTDSCMITVLFKKETGLSIIMRKSELLRLSEDVFPCRQDNCNAYCILCSVLSPFELMYLLGQAKISTAMYIFVPWVHKHAVCIRSPWFTVNVTWTCLWNCSLLT